jgi:hypothetical protein
MSRVDKIVTSQIDGDLNAKNETNTYSYNFNGILVRSDDDRVGKKVVGPGVLYGANKDSADQSGLNTIKLIPNEDINTDQYIIIEPTAPNHIHIRAGGTQDASNANLFLGGEVTNIVVSDSLDSVILNGSSGEYLENSLNPDNQIATIGDINAARFGASASFFSTADQGPFAEDTIQAFSFNNTDWATGVSLASTNRVTMTNAGKYNIAFSGQVRQTQSSGNVYIWLNKNGTPIANTNTKVAISSSSPYSVAAWNFFVDAAADDYYQLMWSSDSEHTVMEYEAATGSGATLKPAIPSIILTVNQVG